MPSTKFSPELQPRLDAVIATIKDKTVKTSFKTAYTANNGDMAAVKTALAANNVLPQDVAKIDLAHTIATVVNNSVPVVQAVSSLDNVNNLRDLALNYNTPALAQSIKPQIAAAGMADADAATQANVSSASIMKHLFHNGQTSAVLQGMATRGELPVADANIKTGVATFFNNQPDYNIRTNSIYNALSHPDALKDINPVNHGAVINTLKSIQRVQALSPDNETVSNLMGNNLLSAHQITEMPQKNFIATYSNALGEDNAKVVYANASNARMQNELVTAQIRDAVKPTGINIIDQGQTQEMMLEKLHKKFRKTGTNISWEALFGNVDLCECGDCNSVYSPASYFVELLQYLRNNNLHPKPGINSRNTGRLGIAGTPLEKLFLRRPDLGCLELTCANTNTILPYIDLVNEVLESFIVHDPATQITINNTTPVTVSVNDNIDVWNTETETTGELLAQAQHTNYNAYCILKSQVYPFTLPYHQPIDVIRIFLQFLNTSRYELLKTFQSIPMNFPVPLSGNPAFTVPQQKELTQYIEKGLHRATDAEYLGLTEEEYIILTKKAYRDVDYYNIVCNATYSDSEYQSKIGVRNVWEYYGYSSDADMNDDRGGTGLMFAQAQFLPLTGILYTDLINLLKTQFINPCYPQGEALTILDSVRYSYSYLMSLETTDTDPKKRLAPVVQALQDYNDLNKIRKRKEQTGSCPEVLTSENTFCDDDIANWVYCYFDKIGKLIVLEGNDGPFFPITGYLYAVLSYREKSEGSGGFQEFGYMGTLDGNGIINDPEKVLLGQISQRDGSINFNSHNKDIMPSAGGGTPTTYYTLITTGLSTSNNLRDISLSFNVYDQQLALDPATGAPVLGNEKIIGTIRQDDNNSFYVSSSYADDTSVPVTFMPTPDSCDISKVTIQHLDGSQLDDCEWDKMQRFIRLWRKLGWTMDETDKAIMAFGCPPAVQSTGGSATPSGSPTDCFSEFKDDCNSNNPNGGCNCGNTNGECTCGNCDISRELLHQLVSVERLLESTGFEIDDLLTFWANISTFGDTESQYALMFLTPNMTGVDTIFEADSNGNYLATPAKISDHLPILMAAFNLQAKDIANILALGGIATSDANSFTLQNITFIYRYSLLMRTLGVKSFELQAITSPTLFGNPFSDAHTTYKFLDNWGKMEDAGFTYRQLNFIINNADDISKPLTPTLKTILQLAKNIYDGLNKIDTDNPDITNPADINDALITQETTLLYSASVVTQILAFLNGTTTYTTNAPTITDPVKQAAFDTALTANTDLQAKLKYDYINGQLQVTGILSANEITAANALSADPEWPKAIHRAGNQAQLFYNDILDAIFQSPYLPAGQQPSDAQAQMLAGDNNTPQPPAVPGGPVPPTSAEIKKQYFLPVFLPYLREQLYNKFLITTLASATGAANDVITSLITTVLTALPTPAATTKVPIIEIFKAIKNEPAEGTIGWTGYLIPNADDIYTFVVTGDPSGVPPASPITIDGFTPTFSLNAQKDPSNLWFSQPVKLKNGKPYLFTVNGLLANMSQINWKTATASTAAIPASCLLPDCSGNVKSAFIQLQQASILVTGFNLSGDEVDYLEANGADFGQLDFNKFTFQSFLRLQAYTSLRKSLPPSDTTLIKFFAWAKTATNDITSLYTKINELTAWIPLTGQNTQLPADNDIAKLIGPTHFNLGVSDFYNEKNLLKLQNALFVANKIAMDIDLLFQWAVPTSKFWVCHAIADSIQKTMKARYKETDWEQVVKPLNDQLRGNMRNALVSYLLVQPGLIDWGVKDVNSLFEFFLIDTQMDSCMETSRLKQAISSVQLYVQRCFLGLEAPDVSNSDLDKTRWEWMQRDVLWQANRQVFLYPENWIDESLRDDKSSFYVELESELKQKDISTATVEAALKNYLYKLDTVANMHVVGLYVETIETNSHNRIHVFGRTRNAPYFFYYRYFDMDAATWTAWEQIQMDIPSYDVTDNVTQQVKENGCFLIPVVFDDRLLIFFPQFATKTQPASTGTQTFQQIGNGTVSSTQPILTWEIKMAWSEYRNGKWTQKQVSQDAIYDTTLSGTPGVLAPASSYCFLPNLDSADDSLYICVYNVNSSGTGTGINKFMFTGNNVFLCGGTPDVPGTLPTDFQYSGNELSSLQEPAPTSNGIDLTGIYYSGNSLFPSINMEYLGASGYTSTGSIDFHHLYTHQLLGKINNDDLLEFFECVPNFPSNPITSDNDPGAGNEVDLQLMFGSTKDEAGNNIFDELKAPYSIYNWELFFHLPASLAGSLSSAQNFEAAMQWYHYIFNPMIEKGGDNTRWWRFVPFQNTDAMDYLENLFNSLKPNTHDIVNGQIEQWRDNPYQPHIIARQRPSAYMKWLVMQYLDNLIAWGDYLFTQHTIESMNQATQLYVLAYHIMGKRPEIIPARGKIAPETYNSLLNKWDDFGNAMVEMELVFPFSNQISEISEYDPTHGETIFPNIFGFASSLYFCIPSNPTLLAYWDTLDDRLYKIRHCENIQGVFGLPPLWDPPIDPGLLVQAEAAGLSLDSVLNDLSSPVPNYRFNYLISKAIELCGELKSMGNNLLSIFEKQDGEALAVMRATHETVMNGLVMTIKTKQLDEANAALDGLQQNRLGPVYRLQHYLNLLGEDLSSVPGPDSDFSQLADPIQTIQGDSGLKLISFEKEEMDKASEAQDWQTGIGVVETLASILHIIPIVQADAMPFGMGVGVAIGGTMFGNAAQAVARGLQIKAGDLSYQSSNSQRIGGFLRQMQDRVLQANNAGFEIKQIDKQILTQQIRIAIANQEITNQQKMIDNSNDVLDFLTNKYTNQELYSWLQDNVQTLYYQVYTLAYGLAQKAEKVYRYERGLTDSNYIQFGYWDASQNGLLAGERLFLGIKQLESAYQEERGYDYEITKHISLRQVDPLALLNLKANSSCVFDLPEILYDMDFPGHYMRKIKSVSVSIPCIVGPYTGINATLSMTANTIRINSATPDKYLQSTDQNDNRFITVNVPITAIAVSNGQNDSGMFELNFKDERYMPFEGAGAISSWQLSLPATFKQFDYNTINDVIIQVRYTSIDGGQPMSAGANGVLKKFLNQQANLSQDEGIFTFFDLKNDFPNEWYQAMQSPPDVNGNRIMNLNNLTDRLPVFTRGSTNLIATDFYLFGSPKPLPGTYTITQNNNDNAFGTGHIPVGSYDSVTMEGQSIPMDNWQFKIGGNVATPPTNLLMAVRYKFQLP